MHVETLVYFGETLAGWISIGPIADIAWAEPRGAQLGTKAATTAGLSCWANLFTGLWEKARVDGN